MSKKNDSWGIEVGANAIKALRLIREGNNVTLSEFDVLPFKKVLTTPDLNVDEAIQINLDQLMQRHDLTRSTVMVSVPGHMAFARFAKLPPVDPKKIPDIVKFEAVQQIPFPIEQVEWDYQVFEKPDSPDVEVGIFAIMRERVLEFLENYRRLGLNIDGLTLSPLAVYNAMAYDLDLKADSRGVIFVDIGTTSTDVVVADAGHAWLRTLPLGGNNFTEALMEAFKLSFPKADKLKREASTSKYARQIYVAMRPVFADLVQEIQRSLGYYLSLNRDAHLTQMIGMGSTFRLPGLRKFLKQQLQLEVIRPDGFQRIGMEGKRASDLATQALNLTTVYGLAIQGLGLEQVTANVLPVHIVKQRMWKAKQPWMAAAASLVVMASAAAAARQWSDKAAYFTGVAPHERAVKQVTNRAKELQQQWDEIQVGNSRQQIENLQRIPDYRHVWPSVLQDIHDAFSMTLPREQLLVPDYAAIKDIPRAERTRANITSITSSYEFDTEKAAGQGQVVKLDATPLTIDEIWGPQGDVDEDDADVEDDEEAGIARKPSLLVTISGTVTHKDGRKLITNALEPWLRENRDRANRPYRVLPIGPNMGIDFEALGGPNVRGPARARAGDARRPGRVLDRGQDAFARRNLGGIAAGERVNRGGLNRDRFQRGGGPAVAGETVEDLLPLHPLSKEPVDNDWQFTVSWKIELKRPTDSRISETTGEQVPDAEQGEHASDARKETQS